jgi:hypothetical protein
MRDRIEALAHDLYQAATARSNNEGDDEPAGGYAG